MASAKNYGKSEDLGGRRIIRSEEHTSELQSHSDLVCRLLLEKKKIIRESTAPVACTEHGLTHATSGTAISVASLPHPSARLSPSTPVHPTSRIPPRHCPDQHH